jgi:hypothetical protein
VWSSVGLARSPAGPEEKTSLWSAARGGSTIGPRPGYSSWVLVLPLHPVAARSLLRQILAGGSVRFTSHALAELRKDGITRERAFVVLGGGVVREAECEHGEWRHQVQAGMDVIVVTFETETNAVVITGWRRTR